MKYVLVLLVLILSTACTPQYVVQKSLLTMYNATNVNVNVNSNTSTEDCKFSFVEGDIEHNKLEIRRIMSDRLVGNMGYIDAMELADKISDKFKDNPSEFELQYRKYICGR